MVLKPVVNNGINYQPQLVCPISSINSILGMFVDKEGHFCLGEAVNAVFAFFVPRVKKPHHRDPIRMRELPMEG